MKPVGGFLLDSWTTSMLLKDNECVVSSSAKMITNIGKNEMYKENAGKGRKRFTPIIFNIYTRTYIHMHMHI